MSSEVSLDTLAQGQATGHVHGAKMGSPSSTNAMPFMMKYQVCSETVVEAFCFANVHSVPISVPSTLASDIDAGFMEIDRPNGVKFKSVNSGTLASPIDKRWGVSVSYQVAR